MPSVPLRAVFFDFDDTLTQYPGGFDHILSQVYSLAEAVGASPEDRDLFARAFWNATCGLWAAMHAGNIRGDEVRLQRIRRGLEAIGIDDPGLALRMRDRWDDLAVELGSLRPGAIDLLSRLRGRVFLGLITDGYSDLQRRKLERLGIIPLFNRVQISEEVGASKPFARAFELSLVAAGVSPSEALMVGDNVNADVRGALGIGMSAVHLDPASTHDTPLGALWAPDMPALSRIIAARLES